MEPVPAPHETRWMVWTDHNAAKFVGRIGPEWFWAASGPRGHESGCESTAELAREKAYAAAMLLAGTYERERKVEGAR